MAQGFEEVFPHRLSYAEKVALFRSAAHVEGLLSSGFTNVVYCYPQISVPVLANVRRDADTLFTGFCKLMGHKLWFMTGIDSDLRDVNSDCTIDTNVLQPKGDGGWINGGFFVLQPEVVNLIGGDDTVWEREPLENLSASGPLGAYLHQSFLQLRDTLRDKMFPKELWSSGKAPWKKG